MTTNFLSIGDSLINLDAIDSIQPNSSGGSILRMRNGETITCMPVPSSIAHTINTLTDPIQQIAESVTRDAWTDPKNETIRTWVERAGTLEQERNALEARIAEVLDRAEKAEAERDEAAKKWNQYRNERNAILNDLKQFATYLTQEGKHTSASALQGLIARHSS